MIRCLAVAALCACATAQTRESIEAQKKSVAAQREAISRYREPLRPLDAAAPEPQCDPLPEETVAPMIESAAKAQKLPAKLIRAVVAQESGFRPCAVSKDGAQGLMQLMPSTVEQLAVADPFEPKANLEAGARFLRLLLEKFKGDLPLSLAAYNAGPGAVEDIKAVPDIPETRDYVNAIVKAMGVRQIDLPNIPKPKPIGN